MTWRGERRATLPGNWRTIRKRILQRDPTCKLGFDCCTVTSAEVDHIGAPTDHRDHMLRGVCVPCHKRRTAEQSFAARPSRERPRPQHPGVIA